MTIWTINKPVVNKPGNPSHYKSTYLLNPVFAPIAEVFEFLKHHRRPVYLSLAYLLCFLLAGIPATSQVYSLKDAVQTAMNNYGSIKAKASYVKSFEASVREASVDHFPNFSVGMSQAYGTVNGQFGPLVSSGGLTAASSGPPFPDQNWHAAFGSLYLANVNWDFFTFGRVNQKVKVAEAEVMRQSSDLEQEKFQHQVRVASAYLNVLAAQRLKLSAQRYLERANALRDVVVTRTKNGLNPGVDSSLANAEVSNAKIALTNTLTYEVTQASLLAELMGIPYRSDFILDTIFVNRIPASLNVSPVAKEEDHPVLKFYQSRITVSKQQEKYYNRFKYPVFSLIGVVQSRGSGFYTNYNEQSPDAFTHSYWNGIKPARTNYLVGMGVSWNITNTQRAHQQVVAQEWTSKGLQQEYELVSQQIKAQFELADQRMKHAIANYTEAPVQLKAASDAYLQKSVLYRNGLATIVDVTQALCALNRAETDRDISINGLWQALLLKAAASGDFNFFMNELQ